MRSLFFGLLHQSLVSPRVKAWPRQTKCCDTLSHLLSISCAESRNPGPMSLILDLSSCPSPALVWFLLGHLAPQRWLKTCQKPPFCALLVLMFFRSWRETLHATSLRLGSSPFHDCQVGYSNCGTDLVALEKEFALTEHPEWKCFHKGQDIWLASAGYKQSKPGNGLRGHERCAGSRPWLWDENRKRTDSCALPRTVS